MADPTELAKKARNTLAAGLQALQAGDDIPEELLEIAAPIAQSMGLLHKIEKAGAKDAAMANQALATVRQSLDALQHLAGTHVAVDTAMEAVAGSLSKLFALTKALQGGEPTKKAPRSEPPPAPKKGSLPPSGKQPSRPPPPPRFAAVNQTIPMGNDEDVQQQVAAAKAQIAAEQAAQKAAAEQAAQKAAAEQAAQKAAAEQAAQKAAAEQAAQKAAAEQAAAQRAAAERAAAERAAAERAAAERAAAERAAAERAAAERAAAAQVKERVPGQTDAPVPANAQAVAVELGAHSGSNFYKGLSGNDVLEHGGIFVATYKIPKIGEAIALVMHLPGDLEFHADVVVQWIRETQSGDAEPGFGARFTRISNEGRDLIYRYVKNREPMFFDDL